MKQYIDLHIHSTASDGTDSPSRIIEKAAEIAGKNPATIALTDHDTVSGISEILQAAESHENIRVIPGVEISTDYHGVEIHILGLGIDHTNEELIKKLSVYKASKDNRNDSIIAKLNEQGIEVSLSEIEPKKDGSTTGRPDIAQLMVKKGYVSSVKEAFNLYLAEGKSCYVYRTMPTPETSIQLIRQAGGVPVLAHLMLYKKLDERAKEELIELLVQEGLEGIETYYSEFSEEDTAYVKSLAEKYHLFQTAGSDYHAANKPAISLFTGKGSLNPPEDLIGQIRV